jgi:hypothetical protein
MRKEIQTFLDLNYGLQFLSMTFGISGYCVESEVMSQNFQKMDTVLRMSIVIADLLILGYCVLKNILKGWRKF